MTEDTQGFPARFPRGLYERLRQAAFDERVPMNAIVTEAVREKLAALDLQAADDATVASALSEYRRNHDPEPRDEGR